MPVGVPRVTHQDQYEENIQWLDLYNRLYRERILFLGADLDDELANQLIGIMMFLTCEDPNPDIHLFINSLGGTMVGGLGVFDLMSTITAKVRTTCIGTSASMASFLLCGGHPGLRVAFPHSKIMIHEPLAGTRGQGYDIGLDSKQISHLRERVNHIYCQITGQNYITIYKDMNRDNWMRPPAAKAYGIVDAIMVKKERIVVPYALQSPPRIEQTKEDKIILEIVRQRKLEENRARLEKILRQS
jgi:ATP-dependent Clp protease, protease subunit